MAPGLGGFKVQSSNLGCQALQSALALNPKPEDIGGIVGFGDRHGVRVRAQSKNTS